MIYLFFGALFGFILVRGGATDFDAIANMFLLRDLRIAGLIGIAALVAGISLRLIARQSRLRGDTPVKRITPKPLQRGNIVGGLLFGIGWAMTGTCPGTALAQLGEGKLVALLTVLGIFAGTALYRVTVGAKA